MYINESIFKMRTLIFYYMIGTSQSRYVNAIEFSISVHCKVQIITMSRAFPILILKHFEGKLLKEI